MAASVVPAPLQACTRAVHFGPEGQTFTGRSMDWREDMHTNLWIFPRGMARDGGLDKGALQWQRLHGSDFCESSFSPGVVWVKLADLDLKPESGVRKFQLDGEPDRCGDQTREFRPARQFPLLRPR